MQAELLSRVGHRQHREGALELLAEGADEDDLHDLRVALTSSIAGDDAAWRWGPTSEHGIELARKRVRARKLEDTALWVVICWATAADYPRQNIYLAAPGSELQNGCKAWRAGSGVNPSITVRRRPLLIEEDEDEPPR